MTAVAVKDDRTTTYAESVASAGDSDSSDEDSDEGMISELETAEAEKEAEAILAQLDGTVDISATEMVELEEAEGEKAAEDEGEWGGIGA